VVHGVIAGSLWSVTALFLLYAVLPTTVWSRYCSRYAECVSVCSDDNIQTKCPLVFGAMVILTLVRSNL